MSTSLDEKFQRFTFSDNWVVFKYDDVTGDTGYASIKDNVSGTKACDFLGVFEHSAAYLIEVKDFRGFRIQNKKRLTTGELTAEVAQKVRDTLAGIISGCRRRAGPHPWPELGHYLTSADQEIIVVLCLEDDGRLDKSKMDVHKQSIKQKLSWLNAKVRVVSRQVNPDKLPGVFVQDLPGAAGHAS